jgi:hypothetical protein
VRAARPKPRQFFARSPDGGGRCVPRMQLTGPRHEILRDNRSYTDKLGHILRGPHPVTTF